MKIAARGNYSHLDVQDLVVRVSSYGEEILQFVNRRGYALGLLEAMRRLGRVTSPTLS
jgi:hypothetical protein